MTIKCSTSGYPFQCFNPCKYTVDNGGIFFPNFTRKAQNIKEGNVIFSLSKIFLHQTVK